MEFEKFEEVYQVLEAQKERTRLPQNCMQM